LFIEQKVKVRATVKQCEEWQQQTSQVSLPSSTSTMLPWYHLHCERQRQRDPRSEKTLSELLAINSVKRGRVCSRHWALLAERLTLQVCLWHKAGSVMASAGGTQALISTWDNKQN